MTGNRRCTAFLCACVIFLSLAVQAAYGANVTVKAEVSSRQVTVNDRLELTISIAGPDARKASAPVLKPMPGFTVAATQNSTEFQFINGKSSILVAYIYTLMPRSTGSFEVGGATVTVDNQVYTTRATRVDVTGASSAPSASTPSGSNRGSSSSSGDDIFIWTVVDNRQPWVGEQITLTFELYNRLTLLGDTEFTPPSTTGFWSVELPKITPSTQMSNNRIYKYNAVKTALFPTTAGNLTIGPASLTFTTGGFFSSPQTKTLSTKTVSVKARPLPEEGKPAGFSGAVGNFRIAAKTDKTELKTGELVTITVTVSGEGNLDMVTTVNPPDFSAFRTYDPKIATKLLNSGFTVGGAKIWDFVLMPKFAGTVTIQPFSLSFFNPRTGKYGTVSTDPVTLRVAQGEMTASSDGEGGVSHNQVEAIARDINFIKPDKRMLADADGKLYTNPLFYFFYLVPLGVFGAAVVLKRKRDAIERDSGLKRSIDAWRCAQYRLDKAAQAESHEEIALFCGCLSEAVTGFIGDRLNIDTGAMTALNLEERLRSGGVTDELALRVRKVLELCDFARFSPSAVEHGFRDRLRDEVRTILTQLREVI